MSSKNLRIYFEDILESLRYIEEFVVAQSFSDLETDRKTRSAVERELLIVAEAAVRLGDAFTEACGVQTLRDVRGMGNTIRHRYAEVNPLIVWNAAKVDVPILRSQITQFLARNLSLER